MASAVRYSLFYLLLLGMGNTWATDVPANTSTTAILTVGTPLIGTFESWGDHDWYKVNLNTGTAYAITQQGPGDAYLRLYNSAGVLLAENDDASPYTVDSYIAFSPTYSGYYFVDAGSFSGDTG